jgi:membrane-associated phospholipid phosphatase
VVLGMHFLSDVLAGIVIGSMLGYFSFSLLA